MGINWLDIAVIIVLLLGALNGMLKGFIVSIFNIAGMIISLIMARYMTPFAADFIINNTSVYGNLKELFVKRMASINPSTLQFIRFFSDTTRTIEDSLTTVFINVAVFLGLFMILTLLVNLIRDSIKLTVRKTPLRHVDNIGGLLIGLAKSAIIIYMIFAVLVPTIGLIPQKEQLMNAIDSSIFAKNFYYYNFIISWFNKFGAI